MKQTKQCSKCKEIKEFSEFSKNKSHKDGLNSWCKQCEKIRNKEYYLDNKDIFRKYYLRNREARKEYLKNNSDKRCKYVAKYNKNNPEKIKAKLILGKAIKHGTITRLPCIKCGNPKSHGHHCNYDKPLEVIWICNKHHQELHRKLREYNISSNYQYSFHSNT